MSLTSGGWDNYCGWCSNPPHSRVYHYGPCPRVKAIEYHLNGRVRRVQFHGEQAPAPVKGEFNWTYPPLEGHDG